MIGEILSFLILIYCIYWVIDKLENLTKTNNDKKRNKY
jgi:large-conductance mechanosensitive channel